MTVTKPDRPSALGSKRLPADVGSARRHAAPDPRGRHRAAGSSPDAMDGSGAAGTSARRIAPPAPSSAAPASEAGFQSYSMFSGGRPSNTIPVYRGAAGRAGTARPTVVSDDAAVGRTSQTSQASRPPSAPGRTVRPATSRGPAAQRPAQAPERTGTAPRTRRAKTRTGSDQSLAPGPSSTPSRTSSSPTTPTAHRSPAPQTPAHGRRAVVPPATGEVPRSHRAVTPAPATRSGASKSSSAAAATSTTSSTRPAGGVTAPSATASPSIPSSRTAGTVPSGSAPSEGHRSRTSGARRADASDPRETRASRRASSRLKSEAELSALLLSEPISRLVDPAAADSPTMTARPGTIAPVPASPEADSAPRRSAAAHPSSQGAAGASAGTSGPAVTGSAASVASTRNAGVGRRRPVLAPVSSPATAAAPVVSIDDPADLLGETTAFEGGPSLYQVVVEDERVAVTAAHDLPVASRGRAASVPEATQPVRASAFAHSANAAHPIADAAPQEDEGVAGAADVMDAMEATGEGAAMEPTAVGGETWTREQQLQWVALSEQEAARKRESVSSGRKRHRIPAGVKVTLVLLVVFAILVAAAVWLLPILMPDFSLTRMLGSLMGVEPAAADALLPGAPPSI